MFNNGLQETEYIEGMGEVVRVQSPGGTQQFIQVNVGQQIDGRRPFQNCLIWMLCGISFDRSL